MPLSGFRVSGQPLKSCEYYNYLIKFPMLDFFGYEDYVLDNVLSPPERDAFYDLDRYDPGKKLIL